jgi:calcium-dependent protein kinase
MEFCSGGELIEIFPQEGALPESDALDYIRRILMAVNHVHRIGIVHRDLKPENFLFSTTKSTHELKLVDFGLSNKFSDKFEKLHSTVGTPFYIAPEVLKSNYDSKCDLWSVGIILYIMLSGDLPFYAENVNAVFKKIESGVFSMRGTIWDDISEESKHLVSRLICLNTHDRLSAQEALMHPAIHKIPVTPINTFDLVGRLKSYSELNHLKKCIFAVFVKYLNFDKIVDQRRAFTTFDRGLSGVIGAIEICDIYEEIGAEVSQQEVSSLMSKVGLRHKGKLCFSEFVSVLTKNSDYITEEIIKLTFEFFDRDRKGYFNTKNYIEAIDLLGGKMTVEDAEEQLKAISSMVVVAYEDFKKLL